MPRGPRIDFPGALQHVIFRGLNRMAIFKDDHDRLDLLERFKKVFPQSDVKLYAWVLMDNHVHLFLESGHERLGNVMKRILTGYAQYFNRTYGRCGYVFQGRFKSTVCDSEIYFKTLIRYIHLNPYRARMVSSLKELASYRWSGHIAFLGAEKRSFQDTEEVLGRFGGKKGYLEFIKGGIESKEEEDLDGGGLIRSLGGFGRAMQAKRLGIKENYDQRVLGLGEFVEGIWEQMEKEGRQYPRISLDELIDKVCGHHNIEVVKVVKWKRLKGTGKTKALLVGLATNVLGIAGSLLARKLSLGSSRISQLKYQGAAIIDSEQINPKQLLGLA